MCIRNTRIASFSYSYVYDLPLCFNLPFFIPFRRSGVNYQDIAFNGAGLGGGAGMGGGAADQLGGLLAPVSVQNLAALAAMTQPVVSQPPTMAQTAAATAPQPTAPQLCKLTIFFFRINHLQPGSIHEQKVLRKEYLQMLMKCTDKCIALIN